MKKIGFVLFLMIISLVLTAQEISEINNVDIMEKLDEIDEKLTEIENQQNLQSTKRLTLGLIPMTTQFILNLDSMNEYLESQGDFSGLDNIAAPLVSGYGAFFRYAYRPNLHFGLNLQVRGLSTLGAYDVRSEIMYDMVEDANLDGVSDSYGYMAYFMKDVEFVGLYQIPLSPEKLYWNFHGSLGYSNNRLYFSDRSMDYWDALLDSVDADALWNRNYLVLGAGTGLQLKGRNLLLDIDLGFDYYLPLEGWTPLYGIDRAAPAPPSDFAPHHVWLTISPAFLL